MHLVFVDDSIHKDCPRSKVGPLISYGAILIDAKNAKKLENSLDKLLISNGLPPQTEIKWSAPTGNPIKDLLPEVRKKLFESCIQEMIDNEVKAIVVSWDEAKTTLKGAEVINRVHDFLFERIHTFVQQEKSLALIICDRPGGGEKNTTAFIKSYEERYQKGTQYVKSDLIPINILTSPSHMSRSLQMADLVVGIVSSAIAGKIKWSSQYMDQVKKLLINNAFGYIGGTGLKIFPDENRNLYHWVLGEDTFAKVSAASGYSLPWKEWMYFENDGLVDV